MTPSWAIIFGKQLFQGQAGREGQLLAALCNEVVGLGCHWTSPVWLVQTQGREISTTLTHDHWRRLPAPWGIRLACHWVT